MQISKLVMFLTFLSSFAFADAPTKQIESTIERRFEDLMSDEAWTSFVKNHSEYFPKISEVPNNVVVEKEILKIDGKSYSLGMGYRQVFLKTSLEHAKKVINAPHLFKSLFGLDEAGVIKSDKALDLNNYRGRITKKIPVLPDQDYVLEYRAKQPGKIWFQRANLVPDKEDFALRDNLKSLEAVEGGVVFREIAMVYVTKWWVQVLGQQVRDIMKVELKKLNESIKCAVEHKAATLTEDQAKECWETAEKLVREDQKKKKEADQKLKSTF